MTFSARVTVTDVEPTESDQDTPTVTITAEATAEDSWKPTGSSNEVPAIYSNTEGNITEVNVTIVVEGEETAVKIGDVIQLSGSFQGVKTKVAKDTALDGKT